MTQDDPTGVNAIDLAEERPFPLGTLQIDPPLRVVSRGDGASEAVEPRVMQVLVLLAKTPDTVVSRATLNARCWGGRAVSDDAIDRVTGKLRRIADGIGQGSFAIETLPRVGVRLTVRDRAQAARAPVAPPARINRRHAIGAAVATGVLASIGSVIALRHPASTGAPPSESVHVAVLPFGTLTPDTTARYLAAGVARQIREQLSRVAGLRIVMVDTPHAAATDRQDFAALGARLGASYLVDGSVGEANGRVRIQTTLIDSASQSAVWSQVKEGPSAELFALQDEASGGLLRELVGRAAVTVGAPVAVRAIDSRAFRFVLQAEDQIEVARTARMEESREAAFDAADAAFGFARQALAIDPMTPRALLVLATLTKNGWTRAMAAAPLTPDQRVEQSIGIVTRALAVDPNDPAALTALGDYYRRYQWRWSEAETLFRKALSINPSYVEAHWSTAYLLGVVGRAIEGLDHARIVVRLDPVSTWRRVSLPRLLYLAGNRPLAMHLYDVELAANPANIFLITELYIVHLTEGDAAGLDRLARQVRSANRPPHSRSTDALLGRLADAAEALRGRPERFVASIDADMAAYDAPNAGPGVLQARASVDLLFIHALEYAWAGRNDMAIPLYRRAIAAKSLYWPVTLPFGAAPPPSALRRDPRYVAIWQSDHRLSHLLELREAALRHGQMAGFLPNGRYMQPSKIPAV